MNPQNQLLSEQNFFGTFCVFSLTLLSNISILSNNFYQLNYFLPACKLLVTTNFSATKPPLSTLQPNHGCDVSIFGADKYTFQEIPALNEQSIKIRKKRYLTDLSTSDSYFSDMTKNDFPACAFNWFSSSKHERRTVAQVQ